MFPIDPAVADSVRRAVAAFEEAGAHVEEVDVGIKRNHRELVDLWCRLIIPLSVSPFEDLKAQGLDLMGEHSEDLPAEFRIWVERGQVASMIDHYRDQEMRTEVVNAVQGVLNDYDLIVTPTVSAQQVDNGTDGNTLGPATVAGEEVERLLGWCLTYITQLLGPSVRLDPGRHDRRPASGRHADHRPPLRRRRRARGERGLRAAPALGGHLPHLPGALASGDGDPRVTGCVSRPAGAR